MHEHAFSLTCRRLQGLTEPGVANLQADDAVTALLRETAAVVVLLAPLVHAIQDVVRVVDRDVRTLRSQGLGQGQGWAANGGSYMVDVAKAHEIPHHSCPSQHQHPDHCRQ